MSPELIIAGFWATWSACGIYNAYKTARKTPVEEEIAELPDPALSTQAELIVELLKADEGWTKASNALFQHTTGLTLRIGLDYGAYGIEGRFLSRASIVDDEGSTQEVELTLYDKSEIYKELQAYESRERDRKQRELTRILAERVVSGKSVRPVLGKSSEPSGNDEPEVGGKRPSRDPVSSRLLVYDAKQHRIVETGAGDSISLDELLKKRYELELVSNSSKLNEYVYDRYKDVRNLCT